MDAVQSQQPVGSAVRGEGEVPSYVAVVPAVEWRSFLEGFSRRHRTWLATVHGIERGVPVTRIRSVALESVTLDRYGSDCTVRLTFTNGVSLCAPRPRGVRVQRTAERAERAIEIDTSEGAFIRLAFRATALPEHLDGVAPSEAAVKPSAHA